MKLWNSFSWQLPSMTKKNSYLFLNKILIKQNLKQSLPLNNASLIIFDLNKCSNQQNIDVLKLTKVKPLIVVWWHYINVNLCECSSLNWALPMTVHVFQISSFFLSVFLCLPLALIRIDNNHKKKQILMQMPAASWSFNSDCKQNSWFQISPHGCIAWIVQLSFRECPPNIAMTYVCSPRICCYCDIILFVACFSLIFFPFSFFSL